jgi:thimet oligopeptidase
MRLTNIATLGLVALLAGGGLAPKIFAATPPDTTLESFEQKAAAFHSVINLPTFETSPEAIAASVTNTMAQAEAVLDRIGRLQPGAATFDNTAGALDDIGYLSGQIENRLSLIKETSTDDALRDAAAEQLKNLEAWSVGLDYREDVYHAVKAYADTHPVLKGEDAKLLADTMRDYRRAGLELPKAQRDGYSAYRSFANARNGTIALAGCWAHYPN